ncbi:hypothetical protein [Asanoa siamensis]|uniref:YbaB/EbfC DNA-binding family protein n=1 Tax=Asanoa siamensis TaxID=926357 RepID=A0ABQ4CR72_9ACTN|nr:hypothetical protein [Asanoa siamensis]GIF73779.1 hypothetical protein Asi02nite_32970 [Asanoa siamensis]
MTTDDFGPLRYLPQDESTYERMTRDAIAAVDATGPALCRLAAVKTEGHTRDNRISVRVTGSGAVFDVRFRDGALRDYHHVRLGEVVTRLLRATQVRAREAYEREARALTPPEVLECERLLARVRQH